MGVSQWVRRLERAWDGARRRRAGSRPPANLRIEPYLGHGSDDGVVLRGRVLDNATPSEATEGEGVRAAVGRTARQFLTDDLPDVPLRVTVAGTTVETVTDADGYFQVRLQPEPGRLGAPWTSGTVELAGEYRGITDAWTTPLEVRVPADDAMFGVISDVDDTILETGVERVARMIRRTITGSALTRESFPGAPQLYADLAAGTNPVFYVSSSPWNLYSFMVAFIRHHGFPVGPVLLRDLLGTSVGREQKPGRIQEILDLHPRLRFVLVGDSGEKDPEIYAAVARANPGRIRAIYIREVRRDPGDGRVEAVTDTWTEDLPFVLAADTEAVRRHAASIGLL